MQQASKAPNVLIFCVDGQRWDTQGAVGRFPQVTPNIDDLAAGGVYFSNAFCTTAMCHPARASFLTGRYPHRHGITANSNLPFTKEKTWPESEVPFPALLASIGYRTGHFGLPHWGKVPPPPLGYDEHKRPQGSFQEQGPGTYSRTTAPKVHGRHPLYATWEVPEETTDSAFVADCGIEFIQKSQENCTPFMLHLDFTGPHYPYIVPEPFASAVRVEDLPPWPNLAVRDEPERVTLWRRWFGVDGLGWDTWSKALQYNLGYIAQIDYEVGRVLNSLDTLGMADNTLVIYMSDHGEMVGERGLLDKGPGSYDALYRVPLIMRLPGLVQAGTVCNSLVQSVDIFPTLMEMANITVEQELDGWSIFSTLCGNEPRESVFCQYHAAGWGETPLRIIRTREWKYVYSAGDKGELYNLIDDPAETRNLIDAPHVNDVTKQLQIELLQWMEKSKDPMFAGARIILK